MALTLAYAYHVPEPLHTLFSLMIEDWIITVSIIRHAWQSIVNAGWKRLLPLALVVLSVLGYAFQQSPEVINDASQGKLLCLGTFGRSVC